MKGSVRAKLMWEELLDLCKTVFSFILVIGGGVGIIVLIISLPFWFGWWALVVYSGLGLFAYLWYRASERYKEQRSVSEECIRDTYYKITQVWFELRSSGHKYTEIRKAVAPLIEKFETLMMYHEQQYGQDDTYMLWRDRAETFCKCQKENEEAEELAAKYQEIGPNGEIIERGFLI